MTGADGGRIRNEGVSVSSLTTASMAAVSSRCPICFATPPQDPFATACGHVFCHECLSRHLESKKFCPHCREFATLQSIVPAFHPPTMSTTQASPTPTTPVTTAQNEDCTPDLTDALSSRRKSPPRINRHASGAHSAMSPTSTARRMRTLAAMGATMTSQGTMSTGTASLATAHGPTAVTMSIDGGGTNSWVSVGTPMNTSLATMLNNEEMSSDQITQLIAMLQKKKTDQVGGQKQVRAALVHDFLVKARSERQAIIARLSSEVAVLDADIHTVESARVGPSKSSRATTATSGASNASRTPEMPGLQSKRRRVVKNYDALKECYFSSVAHLKGNARRASLKKFTDDIVKVTQFSRFRCQASLLHVATYNETPSNIVSSIEFDRESTLLATAGVTKRIKIFEFPAVENEITEVHYPVKEIIARAKLSWVCWNPYIRPQLVSSDYDGIVTLWDVHCGQVLKEYEEHEKRAWSVDFCTVNPRMFASGSDDGRVKIWDTLKSASALTIGNGRANVCSVKFQPDSTYGIAFGSADHNVHYYDLRYTAQPVQVFESHKRTVSYVKFISAKELVSACVDSTIKLWDLDNMSLKRTFTGHVNDKNFVGLSVNSDYIACGSEQNSIYSYYKNIPKPFAQYRFPKSDPVTGAETLDDDESFVSSVCWCPKNPSILVGANSLGIIKVLKLSDADEEGKENAESEEGDTGQEVGSVSA